MIETVTYLLETLNSHHNSLCNRALRRFIVIALMAISVAIEPKASEFDDIVAALMKNDAQLELSRRKAASDIESLGLGNMLPDPEAEFEFLDSKTAEKKYNLTVAQGFEWPGVYDARKQHAALQRTALDLNYEIECNDRRLKLQTLLIDIVAANLTIENLTSAVDGCDRLMKVLETEYGKGNISILEVNKVRVELADFRLQLSEAINTKDELLGELTAAAVVASEIEDKCVRLNMFPLMELKSKEYYTESARLNSPQLRLARNQALVAKSQEKVTNRSTLPGFNAGYRLSHEDGTLFNGFVVGVSVPVWRASKERKSAGSQAVTAKFAEETELMKLEKNIESQYKNVVNLKTTMAQYGEALAAGDYMPLLKKAYDAGAISLTEYVLDINFYVDAASRYIELQRRYCNALANLARFDVDPATHF